MQFLEDDPENESSGSIFASNSSKFIIRHFRALIPSIYGARFEFQRSRRVRLLIYDSANENF